MFEDSRGSQFFCIPSKGNHTESWTTATARSQEEEEEEKLQARNFAGRWWFKPSYSAAKPWSQGCFKFTLDLGVRQREGLEDIFPQHPCHCWEHQRANPPCSMFPSTCKSTSHSQLQLLVRREITAAIATRHLLTFPNSSQEELTCFQQNGKKHLKWGFS